MTHREQGAPQLSLDSKFGNAPCELDCGTAFRVVGHFDVQPRAFFDSDRLIRGAFSRKPRGKVHDGIPFAFAVGDLHRREEGVASLGMRLQVGAEFLDALQRRPDGRDHTTGIIGAFGVALGTGRRALGNWAGKVGGLDARRKT